MPNPNRHSQSPLLEAQATSLDELFRQNPLELTDEELDRMLDAVRSFRAQAEQTKIARDTKAELMKGLEIDSDLLDRLAGDSKK